MGTVSSSSRRTALIWAGSSLNSSRSARMTGWFLLIEHEIVPALRLMFQAKWSPVSCSRLASCPRNRDALCRSFPGVGGDP